MSRKDYIRIAQALKDAKAKIRQVENTRDVNELIDGVNYAVDYIIDAFKAYNSAFNATGPRPCST